MMVSNCGKKIVMKKIAVKGNGSPAEAAALHSLMV